MTGQPDIEAFVAGGLAAWTMANFSETENDG